MLRSFKLDLRLINFTHLLTASLELVELEQPVLISAPVKFQRHRKTKIFSLQYVRTRLEIECDLLFENVSGTPAQLYPAHTLEHASRSGKCQAKANFKTTTPCVKYSPVRHFTLVRHWHYAVTGTTQNISRLYGLCTRPETVQSIVEHLASQMFEVVYSGPVSHFLLFFLPVG